RMLAELRDDLAGRAAFTAHHGRWRDQLSRYLTAMTREWDWHNARGRDGGAAPAFDEYLLNADNFGSSFVNVSHWIFTSEPAALNRLDGLWTAGQEVQKVLRLLNDLASRDREQEWDDLNALTLGVTPEEVRQRIADLVARCRELIRPLRDECPREARYLERQIGYSTGFYGSTDYWGEL
ncbi:terpene synthase family protein, partial [Actinomadura adrarensis]